MRVLFFLMIGLAPIAPVFSQVQTETITHELDLSRAKLSPGERVLESEAVPVTVAGEPFVGVAATLRFGAGVTPSTHVWLQGSSDGETWGEWTEAERDGHAETAVDVAKHVLVFFPADTRFVRYRLAAHDGESLPRGLELFLVQPGVTESLTTTAGTDPVFEVSTINYARPNYVPRTSWGASMGLSNYGNHSSINVTHLWVHHSAGQTNSSDYAAVVRSYYTLHTVERGWSDMGYQWLVDPNGVLYQGRSHTYNVVTDSYDSDVVGAHAPGANSVAMAICMIGDYTSVMPREAGIKSMIRMFAWKAKQKGMNVLGQRTIGSTNYNVVSGHRDVSATACPGDTFYPYLPTLRKRLHAYLNPPAVTWNRIAPEPSGATDMRVGFTIHPRQSRTIFYLEYATNPELTGSLASPERTIAEGINTPVYFNETLTGLQAGTTYHARIVAVNSDTVTYTQVPSFVPGVTTDLEDPASLASDFRLDAAYPNPFNPTTVIGFQLAEVGQARLSVYDQLGREVAVLVNQVMPAGQHQVTFDASGLSSGTYLYRLEAGGRTLTRLLTLLR